MYRGFNLQISEQDLNFMNISEYGRLGEQEKNINRKRFDKQLIEFMDNGVIDGTRLAEEWFEQSHYDVFISHSHNDYNLSMSVAGWLKDKFGLSAFVDEAVWGNYTDLLKQIDNVHREYSEYNHEKLSSYVYAMLATSLQYMINQTEAVIFINTKNSLPSMGSLMTEKQYTDSPWIYQELVTTNLVKERSREEHRTSIMEFNEEAEVRIAFNTPLEILSPINAKVLKEWERRYCARETSMYGVYYTHEKRYEYALDYLYDIVFGRKKGTNDVMD